jgi:cytochrome c peroxidase
MTLLNLAWKKEFFWDGRANSLRQQVLLPVQEHDEMDESLDRVATKLTSNPIYPPLFQKAFGSNHISADRIALALEQFVLTLTSYRSKFDLAMAGLTQLSAEEQKGFELFMTEYEPRMGQFGADCFHCHGGALFTDSQFHSNGLDIEESFRPPPFAISRKPRPICTTAASKPSSKWSITTPPEFNLTLT